MEDSKTLYKEIVKQMQSLEACWMCFKTECQVSR